MRTGLQAIVVSAALLLAFGCDKKKSDKKGPTTPKTTKKSSKTSASGAGKATGGKTGNTATPKADDPAVKDIPFKASAATDPARLPRKPKVEPLMVRVRTIFVPFGKKWDKAAAKRRATRLAHAARKKDARFFELAKTFSEVPKKRRGVPQKMYRGPSNVDPKLVDAALALGLGQVSDPVLGKKGYTVIHRIEEIASAHILVMYKGARSAPGGLKRSKAQAQKRAEKYAKLAKAGKEPFFVLAGRYSDSPSKVGGGVIIPLSEGKVPGLDKYFEALSKLEANEVSDVVETPYGFHVIKRLKLEEILVRHVLIRHKKAKNAGDTKRKPAEAKALARKIAKQAKEGADFKELAKKHSEDKAVELSSGNHGGLLPPFARGEMVTRFWQFAFALDVGKVSDVVETPFGFHVIKRVR